MRPKFLMHWLFAWVVILMGLCASGAMGAGELLWARRYGYSYAGPDYARGMALDKLGNVVVAGQSLGGAATYYDYALIKYDKAGKRLWTRRYSGPTGYDEPFGVAVDGAGNIAVTGKSFGTRGIGLPDILTVSYGPNGNFRWARRYFGGSAAHEEGRAVAMDAEGNVYVAGIASSKTSNYQDAVLLKYSSAGELLWVRTYDGSLKDNDGYFSLAVDGAGNAVAAGFSTQSGLNLQDFLIAKYNSAGNLQWLRTYNGVQSLEDWAESVAFGPAGSVLVTGSSGTAPVLCDTICYIYTTLKYSAAGARQWVATYNPQPVSDNLAHAVKTDAAGNVYVTGQSAWKSAFYDFATVKYSAAGKPLWAARYDGPGHGNDEAYGLAVDSKGNVVVAGSSYVNLNTMTDFTTAKYGPNGAPLWVRRYNGPGNQIDKAFFIGVDAANAVYVSGFGTGGPDAAEDFLTIKYAP